MFTELLDFNRSLATKCMSLNNQQKQKLILSRLNMVLL